MPRAPTPRHGRGHVRRQDPQTQASRRARCTRASARSTRWSTPRSSTRSTTNSSRKASEGAFSRAGRRSRPHRGSHVGGIGPDLSCLEAASRLRGRAPLRDRQRAARPDRHRQPLVQPDAPEGSGPNGHGAGPVSALAGRGRRAGRAGAGRSHPHARDSRRSRGGAQRPARAAKPRPDAGRHRAARRVAAGSRLLRDGDAEGAAGQPGQPPSPTSGFLGRRRSRIRAS